MAAYAAVVSLTHILDLIKNHPSPPISLDKQHVDYLTEILTFLQEFLEGYVSPFSYSDEADPFEIRIVDAAYAAEDVIESYVVDNIHVAAASTTHDDDDQGRKQKKISRLLRVLWCNFSKIYKNYSYKKNKKKNVGGSPDHLAAAAAHDEIRYFNFYEGLQKVIEAMGLIKKEAMEMELVREKGGLLEAELQRNVSVDAGFKSSSTESKIEMVGFDDVRLELLERLTGGDSNLKVIPIVGMGGMGKTNLARNVFADQLIKERFDICLWATISQDYNIEQTLSEVMSQGRRESSGQSAEKLGEELYKYLCGKRYLVVMDDMWSIEVWDEMRFFFPDCGEGSRIIVTTRISNLASHLTNSSTDSLCMSFLNEVDSWTLFSKTIFRSQGSDADLQPQLRRIGEKIVGKCKGLPLSIAVIGGLLAKSERTRGYWEYIEKNLNSIVNLENEEYCLRVLKLSYNNLPAYLKPCFLYMGVFDEDREIKISTMIKLWVSEGFVKPKEKKSLETVAREYLQELVERNLILTGGDVESWRLRLWERELGTVGMTKLCRVHDLVRDLSLREAQKQRFYYVYSKRNPPQGPISHRRIVVPKGTSDYGGLALESSSHPRSYVCHDYYVRTCPNFRLLRTLHTSMHFPFKFKKEYMQKDVFGLVNSRLLAIAVNQKWWNHMLCSSISRLWSLHTLLVSRDDTRELEGPIEFWNMHQLKHVEFAYGLRLPLPPNNDNNIVILENLHTLIGMKNFHLNEDVVRRIPNLTILDVTYGYGLNCEVHSVIYLQHLSKLESFRCSFRPESGENLQSICFPPSLKQIYLIDEYRRLVQWEDVLQMIGELPFVEELAIYGGIFRRGEWETIEGHFPRLKSLELHRCYGLKKWIVTEASPFPLLHELTLMELGELEEIPSEIGEIATLKSIKLLWCSESSVLSAKKIVEEQEDLHGEEELSFRVLVKDYYHKALASNQLSCLASLNFQVQLRKETGPERNWGTKDLKSD